MDGADLAFAGPARQAQLIRAGELSSRELIELYLGRIERLDRRLGAFRSVFAEQALAAAEAADQRRANGERAPLLGVPIAVKDTVDLAGDVTMNGTCAFERPAPADSLMAARLRKAGAVIVGKTNLPELAICGFTESKTNGATRNPWDPQRTPGGSSGGSGAAVAAGLVAAASASDGAGSIRIPAAHCGLFGLKPQLNRIPFGGPADPDVEHWHGMSVNGCLTRTVADTALWLDVTASGTATGEPSYSESAAARPSRLRIGLSLRPPPLFAPAIVDPVMPAAVADAAALLRSLGHEVIEAEPSYGLLGNRVTTRYLGGIGADVAAVPHPERLEPRTRGFARLARWLAPPWSVRRVVAAAPRDAVRVFASFDGCDLLLSPTVSTPPVEIGRWRDSGALATLIGMSRRYPYTAAWNHIGNPAASVPMGSTSSGLPLAVQLVGRPDSERTLLALAAEIEAERPWADRRPPIS